MNNSTLIRVLGSALFWLPLAAHAETWCHNRNVPVGTTGLRLSVDYQPLERVTHGNDLTYMSEAWVNISGIEHPFSPRDVLGTSTSVIATVYHYRGQPCADGNCEASQSVVLISTNAISLTWDTDQQKYTGKIPAKF